MSRVDSEIQSMSSDAMTDVSDTTGSRNMRHKLHMRDPRKLDDRSSSQRTGAQGRSIGNNMHRSHPVDPQQSRRKIILPTDAPLNSADHDLKMHHGHPKKSLPGPNPEVRFDYYSCCNLVFIFYKRQYFIWELFLFYRKTLLGLPV